MAEDTFDIPVIDFAKLSLDKNEDEACKEDLEILAHQICAAFKTVGFLYLENHGISESKVCIHIISTNKGLCTIFIYICILCKFLYTMCLKNQKWILIVLANVYIVFYFEENNNQELSLTTFS